MILQTERVIIRPWEERDAEALYKYAKDDRVGPIAGWPPHKSVEESAEILKTVLMQAGSYALTLKGDDTAIGCVGLILGAKSNFPIRDILDTNQAKTLAKVVFKTIFNPGVTIPGQFTCLGRFHSSNQSVDDGIGLFCGKRIDVFLILKFIKLIQKPGMDMDIINHNLSFLQESPLAGKLLIWIKKSPFIEIPDNCPHRTISSPAPLHLPGCGKVKAPEKLCRDNSFVCDAEPF